VIAALPRRRRRVAPGQRYREAAPGYLGCPGQVWVVERVFTKAYDDLAYARLVSAADPSLSKVLSLDALADRARFREVPRAGAAEPQAIAFGAAILRPG
jgi:hypothetical protein